MRVVYKIMKTRKSRIGGMKNFNQRIISTYSPIASKGGRKRTRKTKRQTRRKINRKRRTARR